MSHTCEKCGDEFDTERGLHIHQSQKHSEEENKEKYRSKEESGKSSGSLNLNIKQVGILGLILGCAIGFTLGFASAEVLDSPNQNTGQPAEQVEEDYDNTPNVESISLEGEPVLGDENASMTIVSYEDFQCPYCKVFEDRTFDQLKSEYIDTGKAKLVWKDLPYPELGHNWAEESARVMECVYREDNKAFWNVKSDIFDNQKSITEENVKSKILSYATDEDVSESNVETCLQEGSPEEEIQRDKNEASSFDTKYKSQGRLWSFVSGTPSFVVFEEGSSEGVQMVGAQPFNAVEQKIQEAKQLE